MQCFLPHLNDAYVMGFVDLKQQPSNFNPSEHQRVSEHGLQAWYLPQTYDEESKPSKPCCPKLQTAFRILKWILVMLDGYGFKWIPWIFYSLGRNLKWWDDLGKAIVNSLQIFPGGRSRLIWKSLGQVQSILQLWQGNTIIKWWIIFILSIFETLTVFQRTRNSIFHPEQSNSLHKANQS